MVTPSRAGVLSTAGGLVFSADTEGYVFALDARSGKPLWNFPTGAWVQAPPSSYEFRGRQYIAIASGQAMITFALPGTESETGP
jgi:alcohol dehydrogenase (cytochrome c)